MPLLVLIRLEILAGSMRLEYSPNVRIVKIMCTGKVDTLHLLKASKMVLMRLCPGCEEGSCHYQEGT